MNWRHSDYQPLGFCYCYARSQLPLPLQDCSTRKFAAA